MNFKDLREELTDESIKNILSQFNVEPVYEDESSITDDSEDESSITNDSEDTEKSDNDMYTDINTEEGDTSEKSYDTILPSPDQLGIDLVNID